MYFSMTCLNTLLLQCLTPTSSSQVSPISQILTDNFFYILFTFCYSVIVYVFFFKTFLKSQLFISTCAASEVFHIKMSQFKGN